jgi:tripartite-type tricarboxylate transporter receptor subunit TctC
MHRLVLSMTAIAALSGFAGSAAAQSFPSRPITMIVPFAAGGPTDVIARVVGERMGQSLGQPVVIENVTGAGGTIAAGRVARAAPDGYTLDLATWSTHVVTPVLYQLQYDVFRDFEPVVWLTQTPLLLVSRKDILANDLKELVGWLKSNTNPVLLGSAGGTDQVAGFLLQQQTAAKIQVVPYRGLAPAMQDLLAGRIDLLFDQPSDAMPQIRNGTIRGYAVTASNRAAVAPEIPTVDEAGLPGLFHRGIRCGCRRARRPRSSQSSMPRPWTRSPIPPCASGSVMSVRTSCRANGRRPERWRLITNPKPTHGGRSSRPPASRRSRA